MRKKADKYPHAKPYPDRHGQRRWRFRKLGFTAELGTDYGSDEFERRYDDALKSLKNTGGVGASRTMPGTFDDLVAKFYKLHFPNVVESTRHDYRAVIEPLRIKHGRKRVAHMKRRNVLTIKADMAATPQQANKTLKRLSQLMDLAIDLEWRTDNPVKGVDHFKTDSTGFHAWDEGEIVRFYNVHELGSPAYLAVTLMLYTGAAKVDAVQLGPKNVKNGRITYRRQKTRKNPTGIEVNIPIHPVLAEAIRGHSSQFTFLQVPSGAARSKKGLGTSMRKWCDRAGLPLCSSHGLRKAICRRIAEAGGTPHEIMSVSGHVTLSEAQKYCDDFGRKALSDSAFEKMAGMKPEQKMTNHPQRFVKKCSNTQKGKEK